MELAIFIKRLGCFIVLWPCFCLGQLDDDFGDGNISADPPWEGDVSEFRVNDKLQLQLDAEGAGQSSVFTPAAIGSAMEWRCWVRLSFSPSANNHARIYLLAETADTSACPDGIFLQLGESGSGDALRLMRQEEGDTSTLIRGTAGAIASSFRCNIRLVLENDTCRLFADHEGGSQFLPEGMCTLQPAPGTYYLGLQCKYTTSNSKKFYFDDVYAGPIKYDTLPPLAVDVDVAAPDRVEVRFSEYPDSAAATETLNYSVSHGAGHPVQAAIDGDEPAAVALSFADSLPYAELLRMDIKGIPDLQGNMMEDTSLYFARYDPRRYDVVINEIMADPTPGVLLPEAEYLELFNTTPLPLDLEGWVLVVGSGEKSLGGVKIAPEGYIILGRDEDGAQLGAFGPFCGLESLTLPNAGQELMLIDDRGKLMSAVHYDDHWYGDDSKAEGGWSLEQVNPYNPCPGEENWTASAHHSGGSPGRMNSVFDEQFTEPAISRVCARDPQRIMVFFTQSMHPDICLFPGRFRLSHGSGPLAAVLPADNYFSSFILYPEHELQKGISYELSCHSYFKNCVGDSTLISFSGGLGLPVAAGWQDLVINEVLFNPFPGGSDYIEVCNRSEKALDLTGLVLGSVKDDPPAPPDTSVCTVFEDCRVLMPGEYALLCKDLAGVDRYYHCPDMVNFLQPASFPAYNNERGTVLLLGPDGSLLDHFSYHEDMHYPLLNTVEGVSLERLHPGRPAGDPTNWHSASQLSGFGTPGYENSQYMPERAGTGRITISPEICRPGAGGEKGHIGIHLQPGRAGYLSRIQVFNAAGQPVRQLVNNELLGTKASFSWDGICENNSKAPAGMYVIVIELTDVSGRIEVHKKAVAVAPL